MKKVTLLFTLLTISFGFAQTNLEDFEGTAPSFNATNGLGTAAIVANPSVDANNGSAMVGQLISDAAGDPWQQADLIMQNNLIDLSTDMTVSVDVYSTTAINILSRVDDNVGTNPHATSDDSHGGTGWETLNFDFTTLPDGGTSPSGEFSQISFFTCWVGGGAGNNGTNPNWNDATDGITLYVDNITAVAGQALPLETCNDGIMNQDETGVDCGGMTCPACPVPPAAAAPSPPARATVDVISFFSDVYTDITVDTFDTPWCSNTTTEVMILGNPTKLMTGGVCEGVDWQTSRPVDASSFTHFHMDFYTDEADLIGKVFNLKFSQWGGTGGEVSALELNLNTGTIPAVASGAWVSIDVEIDTNFTNNLTRDDIVQFVITSNLSNVWYDNLYLHKNTVLSTDQLNANVFTAYPNPSNDIWNIKASQEISQIVVYDIFGKQVKTITPYTKDTEIDASALSSGIYFVKIQTALGVDNLKLVKK